MHNRFIRQSALLVLVLMLVSLCLVEADAQTRRRRTRRVNRPVVTNPVIVPPGEEQSPNTDPERIISTADETPAESEDAGQTAGTKKSTPRKPGEEKDMQQTINALSNQVNRLNDKLSQMSENDKTLIDMERLTRAEQRAESLRSQQIDVEGKLADLQSQLEQTEFSLRPENIERAAAGFGTTRPEEARDAARRALESRRARLQAQIRILETSKTRLEQALVTADAEVDALRRKLEQQKQQEAVTPATTEPRPANPKPE
jgi:DNA repair exonuclease SbcCD ATPase subunit